MLSFQYVPKCSISDIGFDIENYCTYFIILGCDNVFEIMISKWIVPGYSIRYACNVLFQMFLLHLFNFLQDQLNLKRRMWRSLKHGLRLWLDIMIQCTQKRNRICRVNYFVWMTLTTEHLEAAMTHDVTPCSPCGKYVTLNATRPRFFSRVGGTSCLRRRSRVLVLSSSPSMCRARREPLGPGARWRRWVRS